LRRAAAHGKSSSWRRMRRTVTHEGDLTLEQGKSVRSPPPEEEGVAKMCDELTVTPTPHPPALLVGGGGREIRSESEPGKKGRCFKIWFYFSLSHSDLIGDKLNSVFSSSSVCFAPDSNW